MDDKTANAKAFELLAQLAAEQGPEAALGVIQKLKDKKKEQKDG